MTTTTTDTIRANAERVAKTLFVPNSDDDAVIAVAEGLLAGITEVLVRRLEPEGALPILQRPGDILERVMLDMRHRSRSCCEEN
jgi:hypothetical protein